jgi:hypothetical protein
LQGNTSASVFDTGFVLIAGLLELAFTQHVRVLPQSASKKSIVLGEKMVSLLIIKASKDMFFLNTSLLCNHLTYMTREIVS